MISLTTHQISIEDRKDGAALAAPVVEGHPYRPTAPRGIAR